MLIAVFAFFIAAPAGFGQGADDGAAFVETAVPDHVMKAVVQRMVSWYFKPSDMPRKVYFSDQLIRREWLPNIKNIEFVVLTPEEISKRGVKVNFFASVEVREGIFKVKYGVGDGCSASGGVWYFWVWSDRLRLWKSENEGWGSGCGNGDGH